MRGLKHGSGGIDNAISYIHGRLEIQIEQFAASLGVPAYALASRLAALLSPPGPGDIHSVSVMRVEAREGSRAVESLALADSSYLGQAQPATVGATGKDRTHQVAGALGAKNYWAKLTPEERRKEMLRRRKVALKKDHVAPPSTPKEKREKQKIYQARSMARRLGLPEPPLPAKPNLAAVH